MKTTKQKNTKSKLLFRIVLNALLLVLQIYLILNMTLSWFVSNKVVEISQIDLYVYHSAIPAYINANFNDATLNEYSNDKITLSKTIIPGDVIDLSVFVDLTGNMGVEFIKITVYNVPEWLAYMPGSAKLFYATIGGALPDDMIALNKTLCPGTVADPEPSINGELTDLIFIIRAPADYYKENGLCLDFRLFFEDDDENQNRYMNQSVTLRFVAEEFREQLPFSSEP